jgi:hypothetical protein
MARSVPSHSLSGGLRLAPPPNRLPTSASETTISGIRAFLHAQDGSRGYAIAEEGRNGKTTTILVGLMHLTALKDAKGNVDAYILVMGD